MINTRNTHLLKGQARRQDEKVDWVGSTGFFAVHLAAFAVFFVAFSWWAVAFAVFSYGLRMFGITAGFHRYFAHRSYSAPRWFQFVLGLIGTCASQMGPLWWAAHHRHHHLYSDKPKDIHSPVLRGFWWSHMGWIICKRYEKTEYSMIKDFTIYPEIMWLNKYHLVVSISYATFCFAVGAVAGRLFPEAGISGLQFLVWGYFFSTVFVYHGTFTINSLSHVWGWKRFDVSDESRNNPVLALITMGEGWHNNHHRFPNSARQGLKWWEYDISHGILKILSWVGFVHSLKKPSAVDVLTAKRAA